MSRLSRAALALLALVGTTAATPPAQAGTVSIVLTDQGQGKRRELRFQPKVGATEQVRMEMVMSTEMAMGAMAMPAMALPPMILDMDVTVLEVEADGDIRYEFTIAGASVGEAPEAVPGVAQAMQDAMRPMIGTRGRVLVSPTGENKESELTPAPGADPKLVEDMSRGMANTSAPVPAEAVGVGASWDLVQTVENQGLRVQQVASYKVIELTDTAVTLSVDLRQDADNQPFEPEGLPPGTTATLHHMTTRGTGSTQLHFARVMPMKSEIAVQTDMQVDVSAQGQQMPMTTKMAVTTTITPR